MKKLPLLFALFCSGILAAAPKDPNDSPLTTVYQNKTPVQAYLQKHPGAQEITAKRGSGQIHFLNANGKPTALLGRGLTYKDPNTGAWNLLAPALSTSHNGWTMTGSYVDLNIRKKGQGQPRRQPSRPTSQHKARPAAGLTAAVPFSRHQEALQATFLAFPR